MSDDVKEMNQINQNEENLYDQIDQNLYDETGFKQQETAEYLRNMQEQAQKKDKQILDLRKIISKGVQVPESPDQYVYHPAEDFEPYYQGEGVVQNFVQASMEKINEVAFEKGMSNEQANAVKDLFNTFMQATNIFEDHSQEAQEKRDAYRQQVLGENADQLMQELQVRFLNNNRFSDDEKQVLLYSVNNNPVLAGALHKMNQLAFGTMGDIPMRSFVQNGALPDDETLAKEYMAKQTSNERRAEIVRQRVQAGRLNPLPL